MKKLNSCKTGVVWQLCTGTFSLFHCEIVLKTAPVCQCSPAAGPEWLVRGGEVKFLIGFDGCWASSAKKIEE